MPRIAVRSNQTTLVERPARDVVAARSDSGRNCIASGEFHRAADVVHAGAPGNERRMSIDCSVVHATRLIVRVIAWLNQRSAQTVPQILDRIG
jgi:hypothetical protein